MVLPLASAYHVMHRTSCINEMVEIEKSTDDVGDSTIRESDDGLLFKV